MMRTAAFISFAFTARASADEAALSLFTEAIAALNFSVPALFEGFSLSALGLADTT
jgi:hypothetical protein